MSDGELGLQSLSAVNMRDDRALIMEMNCSFYLCSRTGGLANSTEKEGIQVGVGITATHSTIPQIRLVAIMQAILRHSKHCKAIISVASPSL